MKHVIINAKIKFCLLPTVYCLLFFTSCKDPDIGLIPDERIGTHFTDTFTIKSSIILLDSIQTSNTFYLLVGEYDDPKFGIVKAESYAQVQPAQFNTEFGTNRVLDSIVLYLDYAYFYGDENNVQTIEIYKLDDTLSSTTYYNFDTKPFGNQLLGSINFTPSQLDTNTTILSIKLSDQIGNELLTLDSALLDSTEYINDYFKGIALVPQNISAIYGFTISASTNNSAMILYYQNEIEDSIELKFQINTAGARFNHIESEKIGPLVSFPHIHSTFPLDIHIHSQNVSIPIGSLTNANEISTDQTNEECYLQAGIGIRTKIEFPYLDIFKDSVGDVAINKVELVISDVSGSTDDFTPPSLLVLYQTDSTNKIGDLYLVQNDNAVNIFGISEPLFVSYKSEDQTYIFILTRYFQAMLYGKKPNNALIISPISGYSVFTTKEKVNRFLFGSNQHPVNPMKLKVYYTVIK
ncbi:MAG: DUF4270 family protein [Bacteroidetes bacterium]|nr:DUF4270 family protein [Bacteroidota bacterium]